MKPANSISAPRASYIAHALAEFTNTLSDVPLEIFYKETNSQRTIKNVLDNDYKLGIIRYPESYDKQFKALLNEKGLCDIMLNLGFDKVSQICDDHPRFRNFYSDRTEIGLGMSCEAVAKLILSKSEKTQLICIEGEDELLWPEEEDFLAIREEIFAILQNREIPLKQRIIQMVEYCGLEQRHYTPGLQAELFL